MIGLGNTMTLPEFERLLDIYGSDRTRWPVEARASSGQLTARDPAASRLLLEAEALDRILERAPLPSLASEAALAERIVAAAQRSPRMVPSGEAAVNPPAKPGASAAVQRVSESSVVQLADRRRWLSRSPAGRAAGLLAACLMLGIFLGAAAVPQLAYKYAAENLLRTSGMAYTILRPATFQETLGDPKAPIRRVVERFGVGLMPGGGRAAHSFVAAADAALYSAKHQGRNCVVVA